MVEKENRRVNTVQKCVLMYVNSKMIPVETIPGIRGWGIKESSRGSEFKHDVVNTL
jgi:hypothetical protein